MKILSEKEFRENIEYYSDMVFEEKVTIMIKLKKRKKCLFRTS